MIRTISNSKKARKLFENKLGGFTLIELMVAIAIGSIALAAIYSVYAGLMKSYTTQNVVADIQQNVRSGIGYMAEDIMMAGLDPNKTASAGFDIASSTNLRFTLDRNMNGVIDNTDSERITYLYDPVNRRLDQCLYEGTGSDDWELFFDNVETMTFNYLDEDGNDLGDPVPAADFSEIRMVVITLTIEAPAGLEGMIDRTYTTQVQCRNIDL